VDKEVSIDEAKHFFKTLVDNIPDSLREKRRLSPVDLADLV